MTEGLPCGLQEALKRADIKMKGVRERFLHNVIREGLQVQEAYADKD
jgi:hypothetical protein